MNAFIPKFLTLTSAIFILRITLAIVFIWFGALKLIDVSPVKDIIFSSVPSFVSSLPFFYTVLALLEIIIGIGLLIKPLAKIVAVILILHLLVATFSVLFVMGFNPFPILTLEGEFVAKNLVLIAGALVIIAEPTKE